ncbi:MAG TPA: hypothetical protein VJ953_15355 [Saprospiraceae bacterium]|nr:hypothetical protein [Saprospiraceae bacterium]
MKPLHPILFALLLTTSLSAQLEKGMYSLGGSFEMANQWQERQESDLESGPFNLALGVQLNLFLVRNKTEN